MVHYHNSPDSKMSGRARLLSGSCKADVEPFKVPSRAASDDAESKTAPPRPRSSLLKFLMSDQPVSPDTPIIPALVRPDIEKAFAKISSLIKVFQYSPRPLPTETGYRTYLTPRASRTTLHTLKTLEVHDVQTAVELLSYKMPGLSIDDNSYLMEHVNQLAREPPLEPEFSADFTSGFLNGLRNDLKYPSLSNLGGKYHYRSADGSNNNVLFPHVGAANTPYARTARPKIMQNAALPDPGVLFDTLLARNKFKPHPNQISSMLFYLVSIIIHDLFRTDHRDQNISKTSSYLDLSPLYGSNQDEQNDMRTFQDGKIKTDCFSDRRLLSMPPGITVLLLMFNRFHNYVVQQLTLINESNRFKKPIPYSHETWRQYDNDLFQTARLITCGLYINCILKDYVRTLLNLNRTDGVRDFDPRTEERGNAFGEPVLEALGNQVSAEFYLVYRWHAAMSERDEQWTEQLYKEFFPGKAPKEVEILELLGKLSTWRENLSSDPQQRPYANLKRNPDDKLDDDGMVNILIESIEDVSGAFGANKVPKVLRPIEILGIIQSRHWNLATLNEFRAFFNLVKHKTFEDINSDPDVAENLKNLYEHPDLVELYPGLVVEEAKKPEVPGSGLCPSLTASHVALADTVALVRGDRFYTTDYTPKNLTSWGSNEQNYDVTVDHGHVFYKLILRAFPKHFQPDSVYAHFPLVIPSANEEILIRLNKNRMYNFERPVKIPPLMPIISYDACKQILTNQPDYKVTWGPAINFLVDFDSLSNGSSFMLSNDCPLNTQSRTMMSRALYKDGWGVEVKRFYEATTLKLLQLHSYKIGNVRQVDIVRDVINPAQAYFAAEILSLPVKTAQNPRGIYTDQELYIIMALASTTIFFDTDPAKFFALRQASRLVAQQLGEIVQAIVEPLSANGVLAEVIERFYKYTPLSSYGIHIIQQLVKSRLDVPEIVWRQILPTAMSMVAIQGQSMCQCLDFYLEDDNRSHLERIQRLANEDSPANDELLLHYYMEGLRLRGSLRLHREVASPSTTIQDGAQTLSLHAGDRVLVDLVAASHDPIAFPSPATVDFTRPLASYIHYGAGPDACLGTEISMVAMTTMLKTIGKLKGLRRAPGPQGRIKSVEREGGSRVYMTADGAGFWPFPSTLKVQWDGEMPAMRF